MAVSNPYAATSMPVFRADESTRISYLRKVAMLTFVGIGIATVAGIMSMAAIVAVPALATSGVSLVVMLGAYFYAHFAARGMVFAESAPVRWFGFASGSAAEGVAMGYLLLSAIAVSTLSLGNPLALIGEAIALVGMTALGMFVYLMTGPKELSYVKGFLTVAFLPMIVAMVITFVFPVNGFMGLLLSGAFVAVSAAGLLYQMNVVIHEMRTDQHVAGAYTITMGLLVLFWNLLVLLMRLQGRD